MTTISAKIVETSKAPNGKVITTFVLKYPRFVHGELMTHRVFSRNAKSSRAVPVKKVLAQVWSDPAMPVEWGANQAGMQAHSQLTGWRLKLAKAVWKEAAKVACMFAWVFMKIGLAKQVANRILEPWQEMVTIVTATEWDNFYELRDHKDAQPEFRELARAMRAEVELTPIKSLGLGEWHLPFITSYELFTSSLHDLVRMSAARCARVSYLTHEGKTPDRAKDLELFDKLVGSKPTHSSPVEHQATPMDDPNGRSNNFRGWKQYREILDFSRKTAGRVSYGQR